MGDTDWLYGHEATHIVFPELNDNTSDFYSKIGIVMATITKVIVYSAAERGMVRFSSQPF